MNTKHKQITLRFDMIRTGKKRVETRAATEKYKNISIGDTIIFMCNAKKFTKTITKVSHFPSIRAMLRVYKIQDIEPLLRGSERELRAMYYSYPNYKEKIRKFGLIALEFKR